MVYGLRRGEVLGLRWSDVDFDSQTIRVRLQVQRVGRQLLVGPTKTQAGRRDLPMIEIIATALTEHHDHQTDRRLTEDGQGQYYDLIFTTASGRPIEPRNLEGYSAGRIEVESNYG